MQTCASPDANTGLAGRIVEIDETGRDGQAEEVLAMAEINIVELSEQPTACIRETRQMSELHEFFHRAFSGIPAAVAQQGAQVVGPPYALYRGRISQEVDVEGGFPIAGSFTPTAEVGAGTLPAGRAVTTMHIGPYETLHESYARLEAYLHEQGLAPADQVWEVYLTDPQSEPDTSKWQTALFWPLAPTA